MNLISIAALQDNYIWLLSNKENHCVVVDPGEAQPVLDALGKHRLTPEAILLTHHHHDHVGASPLLSNIMRICRFWPRETQKAAQRPSLKREIPCRC